MLDVAFPSNEFLVTSLHQFEKYLLVCGCFSIPSSNACVERVYPIMGNILREERNRLLPETLKTELQIKIDYNLTCEEFCLSFKQNNKLLIACISNKNILFIEHYKLIISNLTTYNH